MPRTLISTPDPQPQPGGYIQISTSTGTSANVSGLNVSFNVTTGRPPAAPLERPALYDDRTIPGEVADE